MNNRGSFLKRKVESVSVGCMPFIPSQILAPSQQSGVHHIPGCSPYLSLNHLSCIQSTVQTGSVGCMPFIPSQSLAPSQQSGFHHIPRCSPYLSLNHLSSSF